LWDAGPIVSAGSIPLSFARLCHSREVQRHAATLAGRIFSAVLIGAAVLLIVLAFRFGIERGDDSRINYRGLGHFMDAVCGLLSMAKYDTGRYVCASAASNEMQAAGLPVDRAVLMPIGNSISDPAAKSIYTSSEYLNPPIRSLFSSSPFPWDKDLTAAGWGADAGYVDFVQFSFFIFGKKVKALYSGFYSLILVSLALFLVQFASRHLPMLVMVAFCYAFFFLVQNLMVVLELGTANSPRLLSLLAMIPLLHATFLIIGDEPPTTKSVLLLIPQGLLLGAAGDFRSLAYWAEIAIVAVCFVLVVYRRWRLNRRWRDAFRPCWPVLVTMGCLTVTVTLAGASADPRIAEIGGMRLHTIWEPLYYDLQKHPDWEEKYAAAHHYQHADAVPKAAVDAYRAQRNLTGPMPDKAYEDYLRIVYLDFVRNDPWYVVQLKYYDFIYLAKIDISVVKLLWGKTKLWYILCGFGGIILLLFWKRGISTTFQETSMYSSMALVLFLLSAIPIWAFIVDLDLLADTLIMGMMLSLVAAFWIFVAGGFLLAKAGTPIFAKISGLVPRNAGGAGDR
jgi:hypothetical protein